MISIFFTFLCTLALVQSSHGDVIEELKHLLEAAEKADTTHAQHTNLSPIERALKHYYESAVEKRNALPSEKTHEQRFYYLPTGLGDLTGAIEQYPDISFITSESGAGKFYDSSITLQYNWAYTIKRYLLKPKTLYLEFLVTESWDADPVIHRFAISNKEAETIYQIFRKYREWLIITFRENLAPGIEHALSPINGMTATFNTDGSLLVAISDTTHIHLVAGETLAMLRLFECTCQDIDSHVDDYKQEQHRNSELAQQKRLEQEKLENDRSKAEELLH